jgi:acetoin utilization protein AcuC
LAPGEPEAAVAAGVRNSRHTAAAGAKPRIIGSELHRTLHHPPGHPLAIPRVSLAVDLCRALGWLSDDAYLESPTATPEELQRFHCAAYVAAVQRAERTGMVSDDDRRRFNLGINGNAVFAEMFRRPATACGASLLAARLLLGQPGIIYSPAGGTHHAQRARASGYCFFNDPVLAIHAFLDAGLHRVFYLDLDAHFGDGVQQAFHSDDRVFTLSIHEAGRWPMGRNDGWTANPGGIFDRAGGKARNLPVPPGFHDAEFAYLLDAAVLPLLARFAPQALVIQCGADALADDPMSRLALTNRTLWRAIDTLRTAAPRLLVLGGGGYNPWAVARCWAGVWAALNGYPIPGRLPGPAEALLRSVRWHHRLGRNPPEHWFHGLADDPRPAPVRTEVRNLVPPVLAE